MAAASLVDKPFKTLEELCDLLIAERGLDCSDKEALKSYLARNNYYRFSGYAREFQIDPRYGDNRFVNGASFEEVAYIMQLDSALRHLVLEQIGVIEIAVRARIAHEYGKSYGNDAFYLYPEQYKESRDPEVDKQTEIISGILRDLERDKSRMIRRYEDPGIRGDDFESRRMRYKRLPIWVAVQVLSFGRISNMVNYFEDIEPAKRAAASLSVQWAPFADVVHSFAVLRNLCAHHRQLWHRHVDIQCPLQKKLKPRNIRFDARGPYAHILMANHYRSRIDGDTEIAERIQRLLDENPVFAEGIYKPNPK